MLPIDEILEDMTVWILSDGKIGHLNQSMGVANALGVKPQVIELKPTKYSKIMGRISGDLAVENKLSSPWPDMVIATGTLAALVSGYIKQQSPKTIAVQMMTPPNKLYLYDVIACPMHDKIKNRNNIIRTIGSPNIITTDLLSEAKKHWESKLVGIKNPLSILVGGSNKYYTFTNKEAEAFANDVVKFAEKNKFSSLLITTSRRTGEMQTKTIENIFKKSNLPMYFWSGEGENPYLAYLAYAKGVVVTADSIGMISESCTANLPVYVYGMENMQSKKFQKFFKTLISRNAIQGFNLNKVNLTPPKNPLSDTQLVVGAISSVVFKNYDFIG